MTVMNDARTINASLPKLESSIMIANVMPQFEALLTAGNTKGGSITVPLTSCLTGLKPSV